ncbi:hypothetical protein [Amycolatopsis thermophila]|uniref:RNA-binding Zn-ribbon protein involved in translation (DUF1610 family) n=1 Tax=Amycolatopsis thermophila TaxID=206084 RepID=A0ABU0ENK0_9PSEU|nr:hypothetical protein [Amycolatopsis thermophila]MDQ0376585.1 putative RNA-binding Zn-ribbon protein involved in translation (DUF1610 family) [Amycolatopsis thermophila]
MSDEIGRLDHLGINVVVYERPDGKIQVTVDTSGRPEQEDDPRVGPINLRVSLNDGDLWDNGPVDHAVMELAEPQALPLVRIETGGNLVCPRCGEVNRIVEFDQACRINTLSVEDGAVKATTGQGDWDHDHFACQACGKRVELPDGVEIHHS